MDTMHLKRRSALVAITYASAEIIALRRRKQKKKRLRKENAGSATPSRQQIRSLGGNLADRVRFFVKEK
jgi:hypothetical protein